MIYISDTSTNPYFNLAEEEFLLKNFTEDVFRLWINAPSIIVGRYQNSIAEINTEYTTQHHIPVVRRLTGGGAVFHDLGNLNFTFIQNMNTVADTATMFRRFTLPILQALHSIAVDAQLQGRNDLTINGLKFSGNAICIHQNRVLMHGTLMFDVSKTNLSKALKSRPEKFIGKAVKSNVKRVTNIKEHLTLEGILQNDIAAAALRERQCLQEQPNAELHAKHTTETQNIHCPEQQTEHGAEPQNGLYSEDCIMHTPIHGSEHTPVLCAKPQAEYADIQWFKDFLGRYICLHSSDITPYNFSAQQQEAIAELAHKRYKTDSWNFGKSPEYNFSNIKKFSAALIEIFFNVKDGFIKSLSIQGDYFFTRPTEEFIAAIEGTPHTREAINKKVGTLDVSAYFAGVDSEDIVNLFF